MIVKEKRMISAWCVIILAIVVCFFQMPMMVYAIEDNITKNVNLDTNSYKVFKINNPVEEMKWTVSPKGYVNIVEMQGKKNNCIVVKAGNKEGTCILKAKAGKKTYSWKIKVKKDTKNSKATLAKIQKTNSKLNVTVKISNRTKKQLEYGCMFYLEKLESGIWKKLEMKEDCDIISMAKRIPAKSSVKEAYKLKNCYYSKDLKKGTYRISIEANFNKKNYSKVIFSIK